MNRIEIDIFTFVTQKINDKEIQICCLIWLIVSQSGTLSSQDSERFLGASQGL